MLKHNPSRVISLEKTMATFLWFTAPEACSFKDISVRFNMSTSTVHELILEGNVFLTNLALEVINWPTTSEMVEEASLREAQCNILGVIGKYIH